ncbi:amino acid ABC transporter permease [Rhodovulum sulfidophilum]|uniref:Amino acid ABC transporter permease n=2 Tax=Rhodovulum sulfidophilum TaxID=35806 RepID=A0ABS1RQT9_RHOSU|nr:amino acid ABC transporter [Rhodovulum sulfidophilum]MBL3551855.1 amino acid ABC transporter permease [Rhodovulum sulfidophilum]MBL3561313.1 amino acid ABC transporter permease [Rhodovulum sulfidophilum]MBL3565476.1 amino acid ABC transporter permease [Rhodovulum sulfidophilum]MBL3574059.1 amino acid ABC transporter permease [Rhodovulum sulfidophilum]
MMLEMLHRYGPDLLTGFGLTLLTWVLGTAGGLVLGFLMEMARRFGPRIWVGWPIRAYVEFIRGTPFLVQLFVLYYGGPLIGLRLDALPAGVLGLSLYGAAYFTEILRAGFDAVPKGQIEAARAIGLPGRTIVWRIMLPVMMVSALPALVNFAIILTKETVILSMITVPEIMFQTQTMMSETFAFVLPILILALFFWGFVEVISRFGRRLERRFTHYLLEES